MILSHSLGSLKRCSPWLLTIRQFEMDVFYPVLPFLQSFKALFTFLDSSRYMFRHPPLFTWCEATISSKTLRLHTWGVFLSIGSKFAILSRDMLFLLIFEQEGNPTAPPSHPCPSSRSLKSKLSFIVRQQLLTRHVCCRKKRTEFGRENISKGILS